MPGKTPMNLALELSLVSVGGSGGAAPATFRMLFENGDTMEFEDTSDLMRYEQDT